MLILHNKSYSEQSNYSGSNSDNHSSQIIVKIKSIHYLDQQRVINQVTFLLS